MRLRPVFFLFATSLIVTGCNFGRMTIVVTATPSLIPSATSILRESPTDAPVTPTIAAIAPTIPGDDSASEGPAPIPTTPPTPTPFGPVVPLWMAPNVPPEFQEALDPLVQSGRYAWKGEADSKVKLVSGQNAGSGLDATWLYVPVVSFPTIADNVEWADVQRYWKGDTSALSSLSANNQPPLFVAASETVTWLSGLLGAPSPAVKIEQVPPDGVVTTLWLRRPAAWSIVPFNRLDPAMKALTLDGASVFDRALAVDKYPLVETFSFAGDDQLVAGVVDAVKEGGKWIDTNRDLSKMTVMVMTGVTALTRATAFTMETKGIELPARDILPFLQDADYVHTSNEVAFAKNCPYPDPSYVATGMRFCSRESYLKLLQDIHLNIVELTGNHVNDWGTGALANTLDLYDANKIWYFGGGRDENDARKALLVTHNGNTIAFIGCNPVGPPPAWATANQVGAAKCDDDFLSQEIPRLKTVANVVVMTLQYQEYYQYSAPPEEAAFFQKYAQMGADLVMGSQAHQPQGFDFTGSSFIHYGFGNLFFDQMDSVDTRRMFADKLIVYGGRHISTVLFTGLIEDFSRPRPMTQNERAAFLQEIFKASGW
jgi:Bacterial capsule synthesis protein PGA_cap